MRFGTKLFGAAAAFILASCAGYDDGAGEVASASQAPITIADSPGPPPPPPPPPLRTQQQQPPLSATAINDRATFEKLLGNSGLSLQWISFYGADRGLLNTEMRGKTLYLSGRQKHQGQSGLLELNGQVVQVDKDSFIFDGTIAITGTPDLARTCIKEGKSKFAITQNRKYFRLREFEWCDGLTDYVDIYF